MKLTRALSVLLALLVLAAGLLWTGCSAAPTSGDSSGSGPEYTALEPPAAGADIALVATDDAVKGAFGEATHAAMGKFAGENGLTSGVYRAEGGADAVLANLELAVKGGAKLVVLLGDDADVAEQAQRLYQQVDFILLGLWDEAVLYQNGARVLFSPELGGWLAGYAAVWEGYTAIGWMGGETECEQRAGLGFLLGAEAAARELELEDGSVLALSPAQLPEGQGPADGSSLPGDASEPQTPLADAGTATDEDEDLQAAEWAQGAALLYERGVQVVFANVPGSQGAVLDAAPDAAAVMGYTLFPEGNEEALVNVKHDPSAILQSLLESWQDGRFPGGTVPIATVGNGGVGLDMESAHLQALTENRYESVVDDLRFKSLDADIVQALASLSLGPLPAAEQLPLRAVSLAPAGPPGGVDSSAPG